MKLTNVILETSKIDEMRRFYSERLGLSLLQQSSTGFKVQAGFTRLEFLAAVRGTAPTYHFAFLIPDNKIEEAKRWLEKRVHVLEHEGDPYIHFESWNAHSVYFLDPAGNIVEFIARHALHNPRPEPFNAAHVLGVNELGLPCDDVMGTVEQLRGEAGLPYWKEPSDEFATVGSTEGLWIVVRTGRTWFMSELDAFPHPFAAVIENEAARYRIQLEQAGRSLSIQRI